jgi:aspartate/methionine/tyrosine aminotransferase
MRIRLTVLAGAEEAERASVFFTPTYRLHRAAVRARRGQVIPVALDSGFRPAARSEEEPLREIQAESENDEFQTEFRI